MAKKNCFKSLCLSLLPFLAAHRPSADGPVPTRLPSRSYLAPPAHVSGNAIIITPPPSNADECSVLPFQKVTCTPAVQSLCAASEEHRSTCLEDTPPGRDGHRWDKLPRGHRVSGEPSTVTRSKSLKQELDWSIPKLSDWNDPVEGLSCPLKSLNL